LISVAEAKQYRQTDMLVMLVHDGDDVCSGVFQRQWAGLVALDERGCTALHHCATNHQTLVIDLVLAHWLDRGTGSQTPSSLLETRDHDGLTALAHAVVAGNQPISEHLLVQRYNQPITKHLLQLGADASCHDNQRRTLMHFATCTSTYQQLVLSF